MDYQEFRETLLKEVREATNVVITSHKGPDDDSIGSVLAVQRYLHKHTDKEVRIVYEGQAAPRWKTFPGYDNIEFLDSIQEEVEGADLIIFLDGNELHRFSDDTLAIKGKTLCVDHHPSQEKTFDIELIEPSRTSVTELLYDALYNADVDKESAQYLLLGILGDTANFRFVTPEQSHVFEIAKHLVETLGVSLEQFQRQYGRTQRGEFLAYAKLFSNAQIIDDSNWPPYCFTYLEEQKEHTDEDLSGAAHMFVNWVRGVQGVEWSFILTPRSDGRTACSFRSAGVNVRLLAEGLGVGGGHDRAAGARFECTPKEALARIQKFIAENDWEQA